ncbi:MAG: hypothetical protein QF733_05940 [Phycisphaerales bacterium]|jgi:hypothetical protein|nr:hypothetical protein [Phycisphaerales bacterium]
MLMMRPTIGRFIVCVGLLAGGCSGPVDTKDLNAQEAALAAEGSAAMRHQDGTAGDPSLATLSGAGAPQGDPFDPDPFITRERLDREADLDESDIAPGAETLVPSAESPTGDPMDQPGVNVQDE